MENKVGYKHYTVGFYFTENLKKVALVKKCKPEWQKGFLNGVGGQIESGESTIDCMVREFMEESGFRTKRWIHFLSGDITCHQGKCIVHYLTTSGPEFEPVIEENEQVEFYPVDGILDDFIKHPPIPNLVWLLPMALLKFKKPAWSEPAIFESIGNEKEQLIKILHCSHSWVPNDTVGKGIKEYKDGYEVEVTVNVERVGTQTFSVFVTKEDCELIA